MIYVRDHTAAKNLPMIGPEVLIILKNKCSHEQFSAEIRDVSSCIFWTVIYGILHYTTGFVQSHHALSSQSLLHNIILSIHVCC
jgi:hypothetical protein